MLLTLSDFVGAPVLEALRSGMLSTFVLYVPQGLAFLIVYVLALAITLFSFFLRDRPWVLLVAAVLAVLPPAYAGHSASAVDHDFAVSSLLVHLAGVTLWVGGLFGLVAFMRAAPVRAVERFSALALWCYVAVALSGLLNASVRLARLEYLWTSEYGILVLLKLAAVVALGWFGVRHRTRTIAALATTKAPFLKLAAGELALMGATMGLAVALSRTPPPPGDSPAHGALGFYLPIMAPGRFFTEWRPDAILVLAVALACAAYLRWSDRRRPLMWAAGLVLFAYATVGGLGTYARALVSVQLVQWAIVGALVPALLAMAWRPWRPPAWLGLVTATVPIWRCSPRRCSSSRADGAGRPAGRAAGAGGGGVHHHLLWALASMAGTQAPSRPLSAVRPGPGRGLVFAARRHHLAAHRRPVARRPGLRRHRGRRGGGGAALTEEGGRSCL